MRYDQRVQMIAKEIAKGTCGLQRMLESSSIQESAAALQLFLVNLKKPLIPTEIQALALDDHPDVSPETIANDILGIMKENVHGNHAVLLMLILDLLYSILQNATADELTGINVPISMMPLFFNLKTEHMPRWRKVAMVFVELIRHAPSYFNFHSENNSSTSLLENISDNFFINHNVLHQRLLEMNMVLRRYLVRTENRGDGIFLEIYNQVRRYPLRRRQIY